MIIPKEGAVGMFDSYLISQHADNIELAHDYINTQIGIQTQRELVQITGLAPANSHTKELLSQQEINALHLHEADYFERMILWDVMPRKKLYEEVLQEVRDDLQKKRQNINNIMLTDSEQAWIKSNPIIRFAGDPNWLPFEAIDKQGKYIGVVSEYIKLISQVTGLTFKVYPSKTWTESVEKTKQGMIDVLSETDDSDLKSHLNFTSSYISNPIVIVMRNSENYAGSIESINNKKIALVKNYGYPSKIRKKYSDIKFVSVDNINDGLLSVSTGEVDALLCTLALCSYKISRLGLNNIRIVEVTEFNTQLAFGVQKSLPELHSILNKALHSITPIQHQTIMDTWIHQKIAFHTDYTLVYQVIAVALFLIAFVMFWNRRLKKEIYLRINTERELSSAQEILKKSQQRLILHRELMPLGIIEWNSDMQVISWNPAAQKIFGYTEKEVIGQHASQNIIPQDKLEELKSVSHNILNKQGGQHNINPNITKDGRIIMCEWYNTPLVDDNDNVIGIASVVDDISERLITEEELKLFALVLQNSSEGMLITDADNHITAINPAFTKITGYSLEDVKGKNPNILSSERHDKSFYQQMWQQINQQGNWQGEIWDRRKNGEIYAKWVTINSIHNDNENSQQYVALFSDITEKKRTEEVIWKQANFDILTGLPNRNQFYERLEQEILKSHRYQHNLALFFIDLDKFKEVNDTLGHEIGDLLLVESAQRIAACVRETDMVARLGGDEFTIILPELQDTTVIEYIAENIIKSLSKQFQLNDQIAYISGSVGMTIYPNDGKTSEVLIKNADHAMYAAKNKGRNCFSYFTQSMQDDAIKRMWLTNDLRDAITKQQFQLYFQPIINLQTGLIHKAEALIRWLHPEKGMVSPIDFIPLAEETGLICEIGEWVCKEAIYWTHSWSTHYLKDFQMSINISPKQFKMEGSIFSDENYKFMQDKQLSGNNIVIEITENLLLDAKPQILERILQLRDLGIQVALDDFGTGYSTLSYLNKFDIDYLKIDQSFIRNMETNPNNQALAEAIILMAHKLGLKVIAEGVETLAQKQLLVNSGCDFAQGYLYSKPVPAEEFELLLKKQQPPSLVN